MSLFDFIVCQEINNTLDEFKNNKITKLECLKRLVKNFEELKKQ